MEQRIRDFIKENNLILKEPIICATSGGVDSVCLITILHKLNYKVVLAHVNHHKRKESEIEQQAMCTLAKALNIPFELLNYHYSGEDNFHNDSHQARYDFFRSLCIKYNTDTIATAHHLDDQIETILIKLMEGSNLYGYGGISICNNDGSYRIIRPLLCVNKEELYQYARDNSIQYFEDSSNFENNFLRNRIRHFIIPLLKKECIDIYKKTSQFSLQVKEAFSYIRSQSIDYLQQTNNSIKMDSFSRLDIALKKDIIALMLEKKDIRKNTNTIYNILRLLEKRDGTNELVLENGYSFVRKYNLGYIEKKEEKQNLESKIIFLNDEVIYNAKYKFYFSKKMPLNNAKYIKLWYNSIELPFMVRSRKEGDFMNLSIGRKKVSRILIDNKIAKSDREQIPIIVDAKGNVLWVYNLAKAKEVVCQKENGDIYFVCEEIEYA